LSLRRCESAKSIPGDKNDAGPTRPRQKGSHLILVKDERIVIVSRDAEIKRGLLMEIITEAGLMKEEFLQL
jgi:predicted RNA binding protein YcfA (HicA-like mRNA interferase family)